MPEDLPGTVWLREHWEELVAINFQWVAATGDRLVAHDADLGVVIEDVVRRELQARVVYAFVDFPEADH